RRCGECHRRGGGGQRSGISRAATALETNWGESAIKFFWSEDDPQSKISSKDRLEIERTVKADLLANLDTLIFIQGRSQGKPRFGLDRKAPVKIAVINVSNNLGNLLSCRLI